MVEQSRTSLDAVFHALADPTRRAMLGELRSGERKIGELAVPFAMSFAAVSKHVKVLENAGLVRRRICGRTHLCRIEPTPLVAVSEWLRPYECSWVQSQDAPDMVLQAEDEVVDHSPEESE
jgi:DNA-binding transcriptional ArsR family regulator